MGLPEIIVEFRTAGTTAVRRSGRGTVAIALAGTGTDAVFKTAEQAAAASLAARDLKLVRLCLMGGPASVRLLYAGNHDQLLADAATAAEGGWLCAPDTDADVLAAFVKTARAAGQAVRAVVTGADDPDCAGVVNFCASGLKIALDGTVSSIDADDYAVRIAGVLAGTALDHSATYVMLDELTAFTASQTPDDDVDDGKLILARSNGGIHIARAVTSLVTVDGSEGEAFKKIKIVEGVDLIRSDIRSTFSQDYVGRVLNDYDSKLLLVTAINGYLDGLRGTVLDSAGENECRIDAEAQRVWLEQHGVDTSAMTEQQIMSAATGSCVFLSASVRFADAMEDLHFTVQM